MRKVLKLINKAKIKHKNPYEHEVAELVDDFKYDYTKFLTRLNFFQNKELIGENFRKKVNKVKIFNIKKSIE